MNIEEQAREILNQQRLNTDRQQENLLERAEENLEHTQTHEMDEKSREVATQQRLDTDRQQENLLERAEEKLSHP